MSGSGLDRYMRKLGGNLGESVKRKKRYLYSIFGTREESIEAEFRIGKEMSLLMLKESEESLDPESNELVSDIGNRLVDNLHDNQRVYSFQVLESGIVNAGALPGGFIYLTTGILDEVQYNRDEVAFIVSHEIMHVALNHAADKIVSKVLVDQLAGLVLDKKALVSIARKALASVLENTYSQEKELDADSYAVKMMRNVGYDASASITFINRLKAITGDGPGINKYFTTHPSFNDRIDNIMKILS